MNDKSDSFSRRSFVKGIGAASQLALGEAVPLEMNAYKVPMTRNLLKQLLLQITG